MKLQNLVNHIVFVLDESSSMLHYKNDVISVFDSQIKFLSRRSQELNQESRVSVYKFADKTQCIIYDMDVMRLPSLKGLYSPSGNTALIDATDLAISELRLTPTIHGDHSFLVFCFSDGCDNRSLKSPQHLSRVLSEIGDSWTVAALVPDKYAVDAAKQCGFNAGNISVWEVGSAKGVETVGTKVQAATENFFQARAVGTRGLKNLFQLNTNFSQQKVVANLDVVDASKYMVINIRKDRTVIKDAAESWTQKPYVVGSAYYQLTKKETIQANKNILVKHKKNGKVYEGDAARQIVGLPNYEVKCEPSPTHDFEIFVQSTSTNRLLYSGTELIVLL